MFSRHKAKCIPDKPLHSVLTSLKTELVTLDKENNLRHCALLKPFWFPGLSETVVEDESPALKADSSLQETMSLSLFAVPRVSLHYGDLKEHMSKLFVPHRMG